MKRQLRPGHLASQSSHSSLTIVTNIWGTVTAEDVNAREEELATKGGVFDDRLEELNRAGKQRVRDSPEPLHARTSHPPHCINLLSISNTVLVAMDCACVECHTASGPHRGSTGQVWT